MELTLPITVTIPRKTKEGKKVSLNMNTYRNLQFHTNNQAKVIYKELLSQRISDTIMPTPPVRLTYTLYQQSNRATDVANVLSIVDKFTCDAFVELGLLPDDNFRFVPEVTYRYGGVDKANPRAELRVESVAK